LNLDILEDILWSIELDEEKGPIYRLNSSIALSSSGLISYEIFMT